MITYSVTITADHYPVSVEVQASSWRTAVSRAIGKWYKQKRHASYSDTLRILAVKQKTQTKITE